MNLVIIPFFDFDGEDGPTAFNSEVLLAVVSGGRPPLKSMVVLFVGSMSMHRFLNYIPKLVAPI